MDSQNGNGMSSRACLQPTPLTSLRPPSRNLLNGQVGASHIVTCAHYRRSSASSQVSLSSRGCLQPTPLASPSRGPLVEPGSVPLVDACAHCRAPVICGTMV